MQNFKAIVLGPVEFFNKQVNEVIESNLKSRNIEVISHNRLLSKGGIIADIFTQHMLEADLIIADISKNSPYVFYELGIAQTFRKPILLLVDTNELSKVAFDFSAFQMMVYDPKDLSG